MSIQELRSGLKGCLIEYKPKSSPILELWREGLTGVLLNNIRGCPFSVSKGFLPGSMNLQVHIVSFRPGRCNTRPGGNYLYYRVGYV